MADGTLECEALADCTLCATDFTPAVAAVHTELWKRVEMGKERSNISLVLVKEDWVVPGSYLSPRILSGSSRSVISLFSSEAGSCVAQADLELMM